MKLVNQSFKVLAISIFLIVSIWAVVFYYGMMDEIYDSIDDGLNNYKMLIIKKAEKDSAVLLQSAFDEGNYAIQEISQQQALTIKTTYIDTLLFMDFEQDFEPVRMVKTAFTLNGKYYHLRVISSMVEEDDLMESLFLSSLWLYLVLLISIIVINNIVLHKLWKPFYTILHQVKNFHIDQQKLPEPVATRTIEFVELKNSFDSLAKRTLETYASQKQFTENASHELQTPLAVMAARLELLLEKNTLSQNDALVIAEVLQTIDRLARLNKSLLLLSKIENQQFLQNSMVSFNQQMQYITDQLDDLAQFKNVRVLLHEPSALSVKMDETLARVLLTNLIKNAIVHNFEGGWVNISATDNMLTITNSSNHGPLDVKNIFKRFYKSNPDQQNTGLGLAIVEAICALYGFKINYRYTTEHVFELRFA